MDRPDILRVIVECLEAVNRERPAEERFEVSEATPLLAEGAPLDSLEFVAFSTDLETRLLRQTGRDLALVANALASEDHPFRSVSVLADHVAALLAQ